MTEQWYYAIGGRIQGPVTSDDLRQRASRSEIAATDLVWRDGMADWATAESLGLASPVAPPPLPGQPLDNDPNANAPAAGTATAPSAAHSVTPPPPVTPQPPAAPQTTVMRTAGQRDLRKQDGRHSHRVAGPSWTLRATGLTIGALALLAGGFWIGHVVGSKSSSDGESQVAAIMAATSTHQPKARNGQTTTTPVDRTASSTPPRAEIGNAVDLGPAPRDDAESRRAAAFPDSDVGPGDITPTPTPPTPTAESGAPVASTEPPLPRVVAAESGPASSSPASTNRPEYQGPSVLFQTLEIHRRPKFVLSGMTIPQELRYRIMSKLEIAARAPDGSRKVSQIVERTILDHADDMSRTVFAKALKALQGQQYTFKLNEHNEIIEFTGLKKRGFSLPIKLPSMTGIQLTSVIDEDGWKELAQFTFFQPDDSVAQGQPYIRQMAHDFSPFGTWSGTTTFVGANVRGDLQSINFIHKLDFTPSEAKAAAGPMGLRIISATFSIDQGNGTLEYDRKLRRVSTAHETFHVQGTVVAELAGQTVDIQLQEQQQMTIRITDRRPDVN